jgi:hypothetical protein
MGPWSAEIKAFLQAMLILSVAGVPKAPSVQPYGRSKGPFLLQNAAFWTVERTQHIKNGIHRRGR